jgi:hypothetical protein
LAWAMEPQGFASPMTYLTGTPASSEGCPGCPGQPSS